MYFVNDRNFYPTPVQVIEQMMQGEDVANKVVLEPSAGSGNIVKWCEQRNARQVLAVEPVDVLRDMLGRTSAKWSRLPATPTNCAASSVPSVRNGTRPSASMSATLCPFVTRIRPRIEPKRRLLAFFCLHLH